MKAILILWFSFYGLLAQAQGTYPTRDSVHIIWQPGVSIVADDYRATAPASFIANDMDRYGYLVSASVGLWSILDIPEDLDEDDTLQTEIIYIAPSFERTTSFTKTRDTLQIAMQNLLFDLLELVGRRARREFKFFHDSVAQRGAMAIMFMTIKEEMEKNRKELFSSYLNEVYIKKVEGSYLKWRKLIDELLQETKTFATTPEECYRFLSNKPIKKGYIMAPTVISPK